MKIAMAMLAAFVMAGCAAQRSEAAGGAQPAAGSPVEPAQAKACTQSFECDVDAICYDGYCRKR